MAHTLTGWAQDASIGQPLAQIFRIVNEETRRPVENSVTRVMREGVIVGLANHTVLSAQDGRETPIDDSGAPIHDAQGQIGGAVLVFRDITARHQADAVLRASEWRYATLAEASTLLAADAQHTLVRVLRTGQSWFDPAVSAERLWAEARDTAHWHLEQALGFTAEIIVPLLARGRVLGTITYVLGEGTRRYSAADLALAEELARGAAVAIENARFYREAQAAQAALQQANAELKRRVEERTAALHHEMAERQRLERKARRVVAAYTATQHRNDYI